MADLTKRIMRRVYFIWFVRQVFNAVTIKFALIFFFVWQFAAHVSVRDVFVNWHPDWGLSGSYAFFESALRNTEFTVQMLMLGMIVVVALLARDIIGRRSTGLFAGI
ncbi:MAG: hypothetical protein HYT93_01785 [Parcubacteria group bacterium]|nr:hypothetical protein [Parcubacteria group bacterium]